MSQTELVAIVAADAAAQAGSQPWRLEYEKHEKNGTKVVADLKAPPTQFRAFLERCRASWSIGDGDGMAFAAAFATDFAVDVKGNTKPTAFHFTAAQQQFLGTVEKIRSAVTVEWCAESLFDGHARYPGMNLRWDPDAERSRALMATNPEHENTVVDAPLEWLAFRGLPLLPTVPVSYRNGNLDILCERARRGDEVPMAALVRGGLTRDGAVSVAGGMASRGQRRTHPSPDLRDVHVSDPTLRPGLRKLRTSLCIALTRTSAALVARAARARALWLSALPRQRICAHMATDRPDPEQMRILAGLDAETKLAVARRLYEDALALKEALLRKQHPEEDDAAIRRRLRAWQLYGRAWLD